MKKLCVLLFTLAAASAALGQSAPPPSAPTFLMFVKGQELHDACKHYGEDNFPEGSSHQEMLEIQDQLGFCKGYIMGRTEAMSDENWSPPNDITHGQVYAIVKKYLDNHPEKWNEFAANSVMNALREAFPLKKRE
jgi:hypothetical protein